MFERLDQTRSLTANQLRILAAAILGEMLEFFDYFLIGFVLAFIVGPWKLSFGQSAINLLSSGIGAILGAAVWGRLADRIGRRAVFIGTVLNFSIATGILALTPDQGWIFLTIFRFFVGFGVGGLYCVDLPLVQEFVPASRRGFIGTVSVFWLLIIAADFFFDGGSAIMGPMRPKCGPPHCGPAEWDRPMVSAASARSSVRSGSR